MRVWVDLFSGDEMVSDSYKQELVFGDAGLQVKGKYVTKGVDKIKIGDEESDEDNAEGETVVNIVDAHQLQEG